MVLENILGSEKAESKPGFMILLGILYTSVAILISYFVFKSHSSLFMIFLATIASTPIIYKIIKYEEQKDLMDVSEKFLLKEHSKALYAFMYLFFGATIAFAFWYVVLPADTVSILYEAQASTISAINNRPVTPVVIESKSNLTGNVVFQSVFAKIFFNNIKVLLFCILFSFIYGAGAIFILLWNASVVGTAIGNFIRTKLAQIAMSFGNISLANYFSVVSQGLLKYAIHGIPEILAYFIAALAGGIISIAIANHDFETRKFEHILLDSADLLILSIIILFIAAFLEVYVTPMLFAN